MEAMNEDRSRAALAEAVADVAVARKGLQDARAAHAKAEEHVFDARHRLDALQEEAEEGASPGLPDGLITSLASGAAVDVCELGRPSVEVREKAEALERELEGWRQVRDKCEVAIRDRQAALADAMRQADRCAREVIRESGAAVTLMDGLKAMQAEVVSRRVALKFLQSHGMIPDGMADGVKHVLRANRLPGGLGDVEFEDWGRHPAFAEWQRVFRALCSDPDAPLPGEEADVCFTPPCRRRPPIRSGARQCKRRRAT
jgi:hypothetical protein